ncbi:MAG: hypothetical protein ACYC7D_05060 [Nitrososphaerales archaeon]
MFRPCNCQHRQGRKGRRKKGGRESSYLKIIRSVFIVCKRQAIPLYSSKYSRKDFTLWQLIAILVMFQRIGKSCRELVDDWLIVSNAIVVALGLKEKPPHYTTLEKFGLRQCDRRRSDHHKPSLHYT